MLPESARGASGLSPYIRHGLLSLPRVWRHTEAGPARDRTKFHDELLWQEYARHLYARVGREIARPLRRAPAVGEGWVGDAWRRRWPAWRNRALARRAAGQPVPEWAASQWTVRAGDAGAPVSAGDDGAAPGSNGGQQCRGLTGRPYGFSRWQVEKRAPELCPAAPGERCRATPTRPGPPRTGRRCSSSTSRCSPGSSCPASGWCSWRDLAQRRTVEVHKGDPVTVLTGRPLAVTHTPVPGFAVRAAGLEVVARHPWPWLRRPAGGSVASFTAWVRNHERKTR